LKIIVTLYSKHNFSRGSLHLSTVAAAFRDIDI
jgi:hypothetical protein